MVFAVPGNHQTITLAGVTLAELSPANFTIMDGNLGAEILSAVGAGDVSGSNGSGGTDPDTDTGSGSVPPNGNADVHHLTWNWGVTEVISGFDVSQDVLDFGSLSASHVSVTEANGDLVLEVLNNGGHVYVLEGIQAEDLTAANLTAPDWNGVLHDENGVFDQLAALGNQGLYLV